MAHDIWMDNMIYAGDVPWHGLGKKLEPTMDGMEVKSNLNLSPVELRPIYVDMNGKTNLAQGQIGMLQGSTTHNAVIRTKDNIILGVVGNGYKPIQDEDVIDILEVLRREGLIAFHTAMLLKGGTRFAVCCNVPNGIFRLKTPNGKEDVCVNYLVASHGHDGTLAFEFSPTTVRVVCQNTLSMARQEAKGNRVSYYIKHTENANQRIIAAVNAYKKSIEFLNEVQKQAQVLIQTPFNDDKMKVLAERVFPVKPGTDDIPAQTLKARYEVEQLFHTGKGHRDLAIEGTAWGAFNAVVEYLDYHRQTRGLKDAPKEAIIERRMENVWFSGPVFDKKLVALQEVNKLMVV